MRKKILIIDDERGFTNILKLFFQENGFDVIVAEDGKIGLAKAKYEKPDLIILDLELPGFSGEEVCRQIRKGEHSKRTPIIMLTGNDSDVDRVVVKVIGVDSYLTKPCEMKILLKEIDRLTGITDEGRKILSLVDELKKEHLVIVSMLDEAQKSGIDKKDGQDKLIAVKDKLSAHLNTEDMVFYPLLKKAAGKDEGLKEAFDFFGKDFEMITRRCNEFFNRYPGNCSDKSCLYDFKDFFSSLKQRMRKEEIVLFTISKNIH
ncbi:MAG: response regulator [Candidatus Omnitrophota bacterium]|nr:response regulator [Candidatus Omnitrophota bacterium]